MGESFRDKIRSINFGQARRRAPKVTTDVHDTHSVDVTEHWEDRQDVAVRPPTLRCKMNVEEI